MLDIILIRKTPRIVEEDLKKRGDTDKLKQLEEKETQLKGKIDFYLMRLPNVMHPSVPIGKDSSENKQIRTFGQKSKFNFELKPHGELIEQLKIADFDKATEVSGQGFNYIKGELALLDQALMQFAIQFLVKRGYTLIEPPLMIRKKRFTNKGMWYKSVF